MKKLIVYQIDSFTRERFRGNPAGVVLNADGLEDYQMQLIARELNNSETAFLCSPAEDESIGQIRYFTPKTEVPSCGHASIAAMYARALEEKLDSCTLVYKTKIGNLAFEILKEKNDYSVVMTQGMFKLSPEFDSERNESLIKALGLRDSDLDVRCPVQIATTGHSKVMVGVRSRQILYNLTPSFDQLENLSKLINCNGYFVFTLDSDDSDILAHGRMFAPAIGINEDPVTGNAFGPLGGYLIQNRIVECTDNESRFKGRQGDVLDRTGVIEVEVNICDGAVGEVRIKGGAVVVFKTTIIV